MGLPDGYLASLSEDLAPYGLEFGTATELSGGITELVFTTEPEGFAQEHPQLGVQFSYGAAWPPPRLQLILDFDQRRNPLRVEFETVDLLAWTASSDPALRNRLNTLDDPDDHAAAVAEAFGAILTVADPDGDYLD
jgi:hypothetical protein